MLSPTFKEEEQLEKDQAHTDKEQARDLVGHSAERFMPRLN
jgi:hypothetical protein